MNRGPAPNRLNIPRRARRKLKLLVRRHRAPHAIVQRARIILLTHQGLGHIKDWATSRTGHRAKRKAAKLFVSERSQMEGSFYREPFGENSGGSRA